MEEHIDVEWNTETVTRQLGAQCDDMRPVVEVAGEIRNDGLSKDNWRKLCDVILTYREATKVGKTIHVQHPAVRIRCRN